MKTIKCQNTYRLPDGREVRCNRVIGRLTDFQVDMLKIDDELGPVFRCPRCPSEQRWSTIRIDKNGKSTFMILDKNPDFKAEEDMKFDNLEICSQVG